MTSRVRKNFGGSGKPHTSTVYVTRERNRKKRYADELKHLKPFSSMAEVYQYLDGETIQCLLCGKDLITLGFHLGKVHKINMDKYKEKLGIPYTYSLTSKPYREKIAAIGREKSKSGDRDMKALAKRVNNNNRKKSGEKRMIPKIYGKEVGVRSKELRAKRCIVYGKEYKTYTEASKTLNIPLTTLWFMCNGRISSSGEVIKPLDGCYDLEKINKGE